MITLQTPKYRVLLTEAAQALISRENQVRQVGEVCTPSRWGRMVWPLCEVLLRRPPPGLEIVFLTIESSESEGKRRRTSLLAGRGRRLDIRDHVTAVRTRDEERIPGESPATAVAWHERGEWTPCPTCGHALFWWEAGYVPGYRICLAGHHVQLSEDGRTAEANGRQENVTP